jgi:hypothetical protein
MELVTRKSECKRHTGMGMFIKSPKEITKKHDGTGEPKYCIIVKPFHASFLPYRQIIFRGVTFSDDFSIELIRNNEPVIVAHNEPNSIVMHANENGSFRIS